MRGKVSTIVVLLVGLILVSTVSVFANEITIGISVPVLSNPFWRAFADFGTKAATELGARTIVVDANQNDSDQLDQIMGLIASGIDGLVITPNTSAIAPSLLRQADRAGIPVVLAERWPGFGPDEYQGESYVGFVGVDNTQAGYNIAQALYNSGVRQLVATGGISGVAVADERSAGLHKFLGEHPDMVLLQELRNGELREAGLQNAENYLSAYPGPGFEGLWAYNDDCALGSIQAFKRAGVLDSIKVAGMDLIDEAVEAIKNGEQLFSTGGQWVESAIAVIMVFDAIHGMMPTEPVLELTLPNVTQSNVDAYEEQFVKSAPEYDFVNLSQVYNPEAKNSDFTISLK